MLRNLFLAIFLLALALPALAVPVAPAVASETAAAACHGMSVEKQDDAGDEGHGNSGRLHGCIGCIASGTAVLDMAQTPELPFITHSAITRELSGTAAGPTIPPPRS